MGKKYSIEVVLSFLFRYVWVICFAILLSEFISTVYTAKVFLSRLTEDVTLSTRQALENKVEVTWKLGEALARDPFIGDPEISTLSRAEYLYPYNDVYGLFLMGVTDEQGYVTSTYARRRGHIGDRAYFQRIMKTGMGEITDIIVAGADGKTLNYTVCIPYKDKEGKPRGVLILAIHYNDVGSILHKARGSEFTNYTLLGRDYKIMDSTRSSVKNLTFQQWLTSADYHSDDADIINSKVQQRRDGTFWSMHDDRLVLARFVPIARTPWTLLVTVDTLASCRDLIRSFTFKACVYLLLFGCISYFGKIYTFNKLQSINALLKQVSDLQERLHTENIVTSGEVTEVLEISQKGLRDELTGLPVRAIFLRQVKASLHLSGDTFHAALIIVDVDNLKDINDNLGHEGGDAALRHFGQCLKQFEKESGALVGRFGGDEFIAYVPVLDEISFMRQLDQLHRSFRTTVFTEESSVSLHGSMGIAAFPADGDNFETLYHKADKALYAAKRGGRDRYVLYQAQSTAIPCTEYRPA